MTWCNDDTFKFIELYKSEPTIWNSNNEDYKDRRKHQEAWKRIEDKMEISIEALKKRKDSLMATYRMHKKKRLISVLGGMPEEEVQPPIWIFYTALDSFLKSIYHARDLPNSEAMFQANSSPNSDSERHQQFKFISFDDVVEEQEQCEESEDVNTTEQNQYTIPEQISYSSPDLQGAERAMQTAFDNLNKVLEERSSEDEYDLYGKLIVARLRKYPPKERQEIMYELDGMLLRYSRNRALQSEPSPKRLKK